MDEIEVEIVTMTGFKKFLIVTASVIAGLFLISVVGGFIFVGHYLNKMKRVNNEVDTVSPEDEDFETDENNGLDILDPDSILWNPVTSDPAALAGSRMMNFLLIGQDRRPGEGRQRSDAMIVCSVNPASKKVAMVSFLRDLYVQIPGYTDNRLNAAYAFGGFPLLKSSLNANFGISVDGCFEVDFTGFKTLIDEIDGIDITLTAAEAKRIGKGTVEGVNHMNGERALAYARIRKIGTDFARTNRQRTVLMAAYQKVKGKSPSELLRLLEDTLPFITTDMSNADIYATAMKLFPMVRSVEIGSYYIPPDNAYSNVYIRGMAVLLPDLEKIRQLLWNEYLPR